MLKVAFVGIRITEVAMAKVTAERKVRLTDLNWGGIMHGGNLMKMMDEISAEAARQHAGGKACATVCVDRLTFHRKVREGERLMLAATVNRTWNTSIEVGIRASVLTEKGPEHVASGYFVFVAFDEHGKPTPVPEFIPDGPDEKRRYAAAEKRRDIRMREDEKETSGK